MAYASGPGLEAINAKWLLALIKTSARNRCLIAEPPATTPVRKASHWGGEDKGSQRFCRSHTTWTSQAPPTPIMLQIPANLYISCGAHEGAGGSDSGPTRCYFGVFRLGKTRKRRANTKPSINVKARAPPPCHRLKSTRTCLRVVRCGVSSPCLHPACVYK